MIENPCVRIIDDDGMHTILEMVDIDDKVHWAEREEDVDKEAMRKELPPTKRLGHAFPLQIIRYLIP